MTIVESLPARPLREGEVAKLNREDALDLAIATAADGPTAGLVLATEAWVRGLAVDGDGWRVVETVDLTGDRERFDGLQACEDAVRAALVDGEAGSE